MMLYLDNVGKRRLHRQCFTKLRYLDRVQVMLRYPFNCVPYFRNGLTILPFPLILGKWANLKKYFGNPKHMKFQKLKISFQF